MGCRSAIAATMSTSMATTAGSSSRSSSGRRADPSGRAQARLQDELDDGVVEALVVVRVERDPPVAVGVLGAGLADDGPRPAGSGRLADAVLEKKHAPADPVPDEARDQEGLARGGHVAE